MMKSVMSKSDLRTRENIVRRFLKMPCAVFLRAHLKSARNISLLESGRGRADGLGGALWKFCESLCPCTGPTIFPRHLC